MASPTPALQRGFFKEAFEKLKGSISPEDARSFQNSTLQDVWTTAREIEREQGQRQSLRNMQRLGPFLEGIEKYSKVIEVLCNENTISPFHLGAHKAIAPGNDIIHCDGTSVLYSLEPE
ncbi:hypothetical protein MMC08_008620 [Hypocenomyce scalaris]|nr:hypothetical protein [Hypocenomyce scalaris]